MANIETRCKCQDVNVAEDGLGFTIDALAEPGIVVR